MLNDSLLPFIVVTCRYFLSVLTFCIVPLMWLFRQLQEGGRVTYRVEQTFQNTKVADFVKVCLTFWKRQDFQTWKSFDGKMVPWKQESRVQNACLTTDRRVHVDTEILGQSQHSRCRFFSLMHKFSRSVLVNWKSTLFITMWIDNKIKN